MPRSSTTALYTRVDNSFSNPVVGTTISPTHADTFFDDVDSAVNAFIATSASSVAIGTGAKTFTVASDVAGKAFLPGTFIHVWSRADVADYMFGTVTSYSTSTGALVLDVVATGGSGTNTDWNIMQAGARGASGATGSTGPVAGVKFTYSTTTTDSDPGAGTFRLNNATVASATEAYIDNTDSSTNTVTTWLDSFDDSTTTAKGTLIIQGITTPTALAIFAVTGSVVDGTGYRKLTLTYVAGGGVFTNGESFAFNFIRTGDKGSDGAGAGDVTAAANFATDNVIIRSDGTSKGVQLSAVAIDDSTGTTYPTVSDSGALGSATKMWGDLFLASGGVINFNNGNYTITHSAGALTLNGSFSIGTSNALTAGTIELGAASDTTLSRASAGVAAVEGASIATLSTAQAWTKHQYVTPGTLTDGANISWDVSTAQKAKVTLGGNRTMNAVSNAVDGATYTLWVVQDATGSRTITWTTTGAGSFDFGTDGAPTLTTTASKADLLCFEAISIGGTLKLRYAGIKKGFT